MTERRMVKRKPLQPGKKRAARQRQAAPPPAPARVTKGLRKPYDGQTPRPSWRRYYQAYVTLLEQGNPVTETAIAKELRISRQSLWRIHRRNPGLKRWVHELLRDGNEYLVGPVVHMLGTTAIRTKSPKHAELFLKAVGSLSPRDGEAGPVANAQTIINLLVPRPEMPVIAAAKAVEAASVLTLTAPAVPVLEVRS